MTYMIQFAHRFHWHPRDVDRLTLVEFDGLADQIDIWQDDEDRQAEQHARQQDAAEAARSRYG